MWSGFLCLLASTSLASAAHCLRTACPRCTASSGCGWRCCWRFCLCDQCFWFPSAQWALPQHGWPDLLQALTAALCGTMCVISCCLAFTYQQNGCSDDHPKCFRTFPYDPTRSRAGPCDGVGPWHCPRHRHEAGVQLLCV